MISQLLQLECMSTITIKSGRIPSSSPHCYHGNKPLHNSTDFLIKILNHGRTPENTSPILLSPDGALQTVFQLNSELQGKPCKIHRIQQQSVIKSMQLQAICMVRPTNITNLPSHRSGTFVRTRSNTFPALWVVPLTVSDSGEVKSSHTMGISDIWSQPLWVVTVEITYKTKDGLKIDRLDVPHSFTKTTKLSVIRNWASIDNKQITIQQLTWNLSNHELTTRTLEPFLPRNRRTRANKQRHTMSIWASTPQQQSWSFETRQKQLRHMPATSYLSRSHNIKFSRSNG